MKKEKLEYLDKMYPSGGGCDEYLEMFVYHCEMDEKEIEEK